MYIKIIGRKVLSIETLESIVYADVKLTRVSLSQQ